MTIQVAYHRWHVVTGPAGGTVKSVDGSVTYCTIPEGGQGSFYAVTTEVVLSDESIGVDVLPVNFNCAPALGGGGGVTISFDTKPTSGSKNAVTSGGLYSVLYSSKPALGVASSATGYGSCAYAQGAKAIADYACAFGFNANASGHSSIALGGWSEATQPGSVAIGYSAKNKDKSVVCVAAYNQENNSQTLLYLIAAGSPLANAYEGTEACLGYVVKDSSGNISACGTRKLSELLTNNTAFAPAALDLDAPAPTPFLPTGITDPIELHQETEQ